MGFTSVRNDGGLMKEGEYEVYVKACEERITRTGDPVIAFDFVVRSDVEQEYQGKYIFKSFYQDDKTGEWPNEKMGKYANALGIPEGEDYELDELVGRNCIVVIRHWVNEKTGQEKAVIFYTKKSKTEPYITETPDIGELDDDGELPF